MKSNFMQITLFSAHTRKRSLRCIYMRHENQDASLRCNISRNHILYDFHAFMHYIRYSVNSITKNNCGTLHNLAAFAQFKKREKHPWRTVNFSKIGG